jgi:hypothetical protein
METLSKACYEYQRGSHLTDEVAASLVAYACSGEPVIVGLAQCGVKRHFLEQDGLKILLPCHKGEGFNITKAFALFSHATKYNVKVYMVGEDRCELLR